MEYYSRFSLLSCYRGIFREYLVKKIEQFCYMIAIRFTFGNQREMQKILKEEIGASICGLGVELEVLNFIFKNNRKINTENLNTYFDSMEKKYEQELQYFENLFSNLEVACDTELVNKFYKPRGGFYFHQSEDGSKYIDYLKVFSLDQIKFMLYLEGVYDVDVEGCINSLFVLEKINTYFSNVKELNVDAEENLDLFGTFESENELGCIIPKVVDDISSYVAVHELIHFALLKRKEKIDDDSIVYGEDLPIFYEYLFKECYLSSFAEHDPINALTDIATYLLDTYNDESFDEQIKKVKKIKYES